MENFLKNCGLSHAINVFKEHQISTDQLSDLINHNKMLKELLPVVGDRLKLIKAVSELGSKGQAIDSSKNQLESEHKISKGALSPKPVKNDPSKKAILLKLLTEERRIAHLYRLATMILIELSLFSFEDGLINCEKQTNWKLIDFAKGNLHCVICNASLAIQIRGDSTSTFNIGNYKRHYVVEHGLISKPEVVEPGDLSESHEEPPDSPVDDIEQDHSLDMSVTNASEWKNGVFGWAKDGCRSRFYPGFLLKSKEFRRITKTSDLSATTFVPFEFHEVIDTDKKYKRDVANLEEFNKKNGTSFD